MKFALPLLALVFTLLTGCCDAEILGNQTVTVAAGDGRDISRTQEIKINYIARWKVLSGEGRNRKWWYKTSSAWDMFCIDEDNAKVSAYMDCKE